jgi:hypothetical protein
MSEPVRLKLMIDASRPALGYWPDLLVPSEEMAQHLVDMDVRAERFRALWRNASPELKAQIEQVLHAQGLLPYPLG